ncbi:AMP-binding protein [Alphaproteobacteria bacterium]|nr:AMP-binding protein [Alphaproteobacteria bacterium]
MSHVMMPIDNFFRSAARWPDRIAVEINDGADQRKITYGDLAKSVNALANALQTIDPAPQSCVGICAYNSFEHLLGWLATYAAGKIWVPLNPRNGRDELDRIIDLTAPSIVIFDADCGEKFGAVMGHLLAGKNGETAVRANSHMVALLAANAGKMPKRHLADSDDLQAIKFTGGSSGVPKGVMQSYRVFNSCIASMIAAFGFDSNDRHLLAAPMTHGANTMILPIFAVGGTQLFMGQPSPAAILDAIETMQATTIFVPPTLCYMMLEDERINDIDLSSLRHFIIGGATIRPDVVARAMPIFNHAMETCFGQTEVPQIAICMRSKDWQDPANHASTGRATCMTDIGIMDANGTLLPVGEEGELVLAGDLVMKGYYKMPEKTSETIIDGWLHTGDIGYIDDRGFVFIKDRIRDVVVTGGFNVYPNDVEAVLGQHPDVVECVVFGLADDKWGEAVHAAVELSKQASIDEASLIAFVKSRLDSVKAPKRIYITDALPRSPVGKVLRREAKLVFADY